MEGVAIVPSLSAEFDDFIRHYDHHMRHDVSQEFLSFVRHQHEVVAKKWMEADTECMRLQNELVNAHSELAKIQSKLESNRRHMENKIVAQNHLEAENGKLLLQIDSAKALIREYLSDPRTSSESRDRILNILAVLDGSNASISVRNKAHRMQSPNGTLDAISEANSTDLSMTQSEDDLDASLAGRRAVNARRRQSNKRPSLDNKQGKYKKNSGAVGTKQSLQVSTHDHIVVKTVVSSSKSSGPMHAYASVETTPKQFATPMAPPPSSRRRTEEVLYLPSDTESEDTYVPQSKPVHTYTPKPSTSYASPIVTGKSKQPHTWTQKTVIKPEQCGPCEKRIKFGKTAFKCVDCKTTCHPECKDKAPMPCVVANTPLTKDKHHIGTIADWAPPRTYPMVPGFIQHCLAEIESRGQATVGLYRIPGDAKDVRELKEKALRNKGTPNLSRFEPSSICSFVKDFLKSLQEPLVSRLLWRDFELAAEISDPQRRLDEIDKIVKALPLSNQHTLAYIMLHLQRVAEMPLVKMPIGNLCKVFGPTIVGYSGSELKMDGESLMKETKLQQKFMEQLLSAPSSFWEQVLATQMSSDDENIFAETKRSTAKLTSTPSGSSVLKARESNKMKRIRYFDDSPKEPPAKVHNKNYFD